jgi:diguanylate cyclase (GGDEF)-like protein
MGAPAPEQPVPRRIPRLTPSIFRDLAVWMVGLGLITGLAFPWFVLLLGVPSSRALTPGFFAATIAAGLFVGGLNFALARIVVGDQLRLLSSRMDHVGRALRHAAHTGDLSACDPDECRVPVDSRDELGASAAAFNELIEALARSHGIEAAARDFSEAFSSHLELEPLARTALERLLHHLRVSSGAVVLTAARQPLVVASQGTLPDAGRRTVPIEFKHTALGSLLLPAPTSPAPDEDRVIELFATGFGVAINNALAHTRSRELADLDQLTGCNSRRFGLEALEREFAAARGARRQLGILMFDLDYFKHVNDEHGHLVGDEVLARGADAARGALRAGDVLLRYGGEEFVAVVPGVDEESLAAIAERLRAAVSHAVTHVGDAAVRVTASVGASHFPTASVTSADELLHVADGALYEAKAAGRDRVVLAA